MSGPSQAPVDDGNCFACGPQNAAGLHLHFEPAGEGTVRAQTALAVQFQGWRGMAHGGIVMALLDEAMAHAAGFAGYRGVTAAMSARFRNPVPLDAPISIEGSIAWQRRGVLGLRSRVLDESGNVLAQGEGSFVVRGSVLDVRDRRNPAVREP